MSISSKVAVLTSNPWYPDPHARDTGPRWYPVLWNFSPGIASLELIHVQVNLDQTDADAASTGLPTASKEILSRQ